MAGAHDKVSRVRGVHYEREKDRWCAELRITRDGKQVRRRRRFPGSDDGQAEAEAWIKQQHEELGI